MPATENRGSAGSDPRLEIAFFHASQLHQAGSIEEARKSYREILKVHPDHAAALNNLGLILYNERNLDEAENLFGRAVALDPRNSDALMNLGNLAKAKGDTPGAIALYEKAIQAKPQSPVAYVNLGNVYQYQGKAEQAIACYEKALALDGSLADAHLNMGNILNRLGRLDDAVTAFERALAARPNYPEAHNNLGMTLTAIGRHDNAGRHFELAMQLRPNYLDAYLNYGNMLKDLGRGDEAAEYYRRILAIDPDHPAALSNIVFSLNYSDTVSAEGLAEAHFRSGAQIERKFRDLVRAYPNTPDPGRRLRIGYLSPDFRYHAVTCFFEPLMRLHDRTAVEIFSYAEVFAPDGMTERLKSLSDHWIPTVGMTDDELAERILADRIDILIDLAGHSNNNRLATLARRPAPVQMTWLGYPNTTGMKSVDYRIVDPVSDPPEVADALASEELVRLPGGFHCYQPLVAAPNPVPPPCLTTGHITFGSFNNQPKLSASTFDVWCRLMARVPNSRIVLKNRYLASQNIRTLTMARFTDRGIAADRVTLLEGIPDMTAHLASYQQIDIALDSFPYNGTTTTCEALWMGVPVVALAGDRHLARVGASLMVHVGAPELVAETPEQFIDIGAALAADLPRLTRYHAELRDRMATSSLCDATGFARKIEAVYRDVWRRWCFDPQKKRPVHPESRVVASAGAALPPPVRTVPVPATAPATADQLLIGALAPEPGWLSLGSPTSVEIADPASFARVAGLADGSFRRIYVSDGLEHLGYDADLPAMLREFHRILAPGGELMISTPDLDALCQLFVDPAVSGAERFLIMRMMYGGRSSPGDVHCSGLNAEFLTHFLDGAGFRRVERVASFGLFRDFSEAGLRGRPISLNMIARKAT